MYRDMKNPVLQNYRDCFPDVVNKDELDNLKEECCNKCNRQGTCTENFCRFYKDYIEWRKIIGDGPRIKYIEKEKAKPFVIATRKYKKDDKNICRRTALAQITKFLKKADEYQRVRLNWVKIEVEKGHFGRALHASKLIADYPTITKTLQKFKDIKENKKKTKKREI